MSDRAAFARLDSENEVAELRRELGVVTDERDTALAEVANLTLRLSAVDKALDYYCEDDALEGRIRFAMRHFSARP